MDIALFIQKEKVPAGNIAILILHIDNKSTVNVCKEAIVDRDLNYLSMWLLTNKVEEVYIENTKDINTRTKTLFERLGMNVFLYSDIQRHPALSNMITKR